MKCAFHVYVIYLLPPINTALAIYDFTLHLREFHGGGGGGGPLFFLILFFFKKKKKGATNSFKL